MRLLKALKPRYARPSISNLTAINNGKHISVRFHISAEPTQNIMRRLQQTNAPLGQILWNRSKRFSILITGLNKDKKVILETVITSESYGLIRTRLPDHIHQQAIETIEIFEYHKNYQIYYLLGSFVPQKILSPKKIVISDFDKTLVDTKYSTPKELYNSLSKPVSYYPTIAKSLELFKKYYDEKYHAFVLSASPHFYEHTFRDWLYDKELYNCGIFLKDYKKIFSLRLSELGPRDLRFHGFYKLHSILEILLMTGIPAQLALLGDGFETDPLIYAVMQSFLKHHKEPVYLCNHIKKLKEFNFSTNQMSKLITLFNKMHPQLRQQPSCIVQVHIRCRQENFEQLKNKKLALDFLEQERQSFQYYQA